MSYSNIRQAYNNNAKESFVHQHAHNHDASTLFNELIKKTYDQKGAFGYICVQKPESEKVISNWATDPDLECAWTFVSPELLSVDNQGKSQQAQTFKDIKHYVLNKDPSQNAKDAIFKGTDKWSDFIA